MMPEPIDEFDGTTSHESAKRVGGSVYRSGGIAEEAAAMPRAPTWRDVRVGGIELAGDLPEEIYFVKELGLVAGGGAPHIIAGYGYSGKTLSMQAVLLSLLSGKGVWGGYSTRLSKWCHVDFEQGRRLTQRRYKRLANAMGIDLTTLGDSINLVTMPPISLKPTFRDDWCFLMDGQDGILIDSLRAATAGQDENSSEIREGLDMLGSISETTGCRATLIHHNRKVQEGQVTGAQSLRGSGAIFDACDCVIVLTSAKGEPIKLEVVKARSHGEECQEASLRIHDVERDGDLKWGINISVLGVEAVHDARQAKQESASAAQSARDSERVRIFVEKHPGATTRELRDFLGLNGQRFARALDALGAEIEKRTDDKRLQHHFMRGAS